MSVMFSCCLIGSCRPGYLFLYKRVLPDSNGFVSPFHSGRRQQRSSGPLAPRLALFFLKSTSMMCFFCFLTRTRSRLRIFAPLRSVQYQRPPDVVLLRSASVGAIPTSTGRCAPRLALFLIAGLEHSRSSLRSAGRHCTGTAQPQSFSVYCDRKDGCRFRQPPLG